jgi:hypothetical protein
VGSVLAVGVAVALSPLAPLGPVRPVYPDKGVAFDWTVLGIGLLVLIVGLGAIAVALAYRDAPDRALRRSRVTRANKSRAVHAAAAAGLPTPAVIGVRFALEPGQGRTAVPVRSALFGAVLAVALIVATFTFGAGLQSLVSHPSLYGWNFTYLLNASNTTPPQALALLNRDPDVAAWDGYDYTVAVIDGQGVPFLIEFGHSATKAPISPPILAGHALDGEDQIVLGAATLAELHKHIGSIVTVSYGRRGDPIYVPPTNLVVVGTATLPAVGYSSVVDDHTSMGTGALMSVAALPQAFQQALSSSDPTLDGPNLVFVRLRGGVAEPAGLAGLQRIATTADKLLASAPGGSGAGDSVSVLGVQRPAEIVNYGTIGVTPTLLAAALAVGAIVALGLTLVASVRRRRRDLALLKTLGFTERQLMAAVAWQASVSAVIGVVVGLPLGIIVGRWLWTLFARQIYAVPQPSVPVLAVTLVALGTLVLANVVAALPGFIAARTPTALLLRAE